MNCCSAPTTRRAISKRSCSDSSSGSRATIRLCSRANRVCVAVSGDVLVGPDVAGDHRAGGIGGERPVQGHLGGRRGVTSGVAPWQHPAWEHQRGRVVRRVAVEGAFAQPVQPALRVTIDGGCVDVPADDIDLLSAGVSTAAAERRRRRPDELDRPLVVDERLERVGGIEADRGRFAAVLAQPEGVVEELAPHEAPLRHPVLGEQVLGHVVEDAVAHEPGGRPVDHRAGSIGIASGGHAEVVGVGLPPLGVAAVVARAVEAAHGGGSRLRGRRVRGRVAEQQRDGEDEAGGAHGSQPSPTASTGSQPRLGSCSESRVGRDQRFVSLATSSGLSRSPAAATLDSRWDAEPVPGITSMAGERASSQASTT